MRTLIVFLFLFSLCSVAHAGMFEQGAVTFDADSTQVSVTSFTAVPIMIRDSYIRGSWIINSSSFSSVCISTTSTVSTTASAFILPNTTFSLDGPNGSWWGGLWATMCNGVGGAIPTTTKISVIRTK